jgi:NADH:ubiquinone oxidoreductase subunit 3 (subunit A)
MKKFELYLGILLIIITTVLDVLFPFVVPYSNSNLALIGFVSALGYMSGYLLIDSYIGRLKIHHWTEGYNDGFRDAKDLEDYKYTH